jgi:hypothetical protein
MASVLPTLETKSGPLPSAGDATEKSAKNPPERKSAPSTHQPKEPRKVPPTSVWTGSGIIPKILRRPPDKAEAATTKRLSHVSIDLQDLGSSNGTYDAIVMDVRTEKNPHPHRRPIYVCDLHYSGYSSKHDATVKYDPDKPQSSKIESIIIADWYLRRNESVPSDLRSEQIGKKDPLRLVIVDPGEKHCVVHWVGTEATVDGGCMTEDVSDLVLRDYYIRNPNKPRADWLRTLPGDCQVNINCGSHPDDVQLCCEHDNVDSFVSPSHPCCISRAKHHPEHKENILTFNKRALARHARIGGTMTVEDDHDNDDQ